METTSDHTTSAAASTGSERAELHGRQHLTFGLGGESFALPIALVREIIEYRTPTEVPMMPAHMRGVINLRGGVVPVVDLSVRLGRGAAALTRRSCVVILELSHADADHAIGVLVDAVSAVVDITPEHVEPAPSFGAHLRPDFISGMGKVNGDFVIILDVQRVLSLEELALAGSRHEAGPQAAG